MRILTRQEISDKVLRLLAEKFPTKELVYENLIYLESQLTLPKGTEHFMSDLHGEYAAFFHILNNCSGVIREKVEYVFGDRLTREEKAEFCTLIYYPAEKIAQKIAQRADMAEWLHVNLSRLLELSKLMSYKYPASKVREFIPARFASIIFELMNTRPEADRAQAVYLKNLIETIVRIDSGAEFVEAFAVLIKRLAVDHLHIVGDFFDRGNRPDAILNLLIEHPSVDIQWGNHDVLWMGAALGSQVCIAAVIRNSLHYGNTDVLERGYGINLRPLTTFAMQIYPHDAPMLAAERAISMIMFKLEGQMIRRNPDFQMEKQLRLGEIDFHNSCALLSDGRVYELKSSYFPTILENADSPYDLVPDEQLIIDDLTTYFVESAQLRRHLDYLYQKGSVYTCYNGNLLFHACVPLNEDGSFRELSFEGEKYSGKAYLDYVDRRVRQAYLNREQQDLDFMYFLWCGLISPIAGRQFKTFERTFISDETTWKEPVDPYFALIEKEKICEKILREFDLDPKRGHIINGHVPVKVREGESPIKGNGKAIVIDGGFCEAYHKKTGISGFTLIYNSRGLRLLEHQKIADVKAALHDNGDIESVAETVDLQAYLTLVSDTDLGKKIREEIADLNDLLTAYQSGILKPAS